MPLSRSSSFRSEGRPRSGRSRASSKEDVEKGRPRSGRSRASSKEDAEDRPRSGRSRASSIDGRPRPGSRAGSGVGDLKDADKCANMIRRAEKHHTTLIDKLNDYDPSLDGRVARHAPPRRNRRTSANDALPQKPRLFDHSPESAARHFRRKNEELVERNAALEQANEKLAEENEVLKAENVKLRDYMNNRFI